MIRAMQADGISELDALVQMCEAGFDAFCRNLADTANVKGAAGYYKGRERDLYKTELLKVLTEHYGRPRAEQVIDRLEPPVPKATVREPNRFQTELLSDMTDIDHPDWGGPRALFQVNSAIQEELVREWAIFLTDSGLVAPSARDQLILLAKEFYKTRGSGSHYDTYCRKYRAMADSTGVLEHFQPEELTYFRMGCSNIFQEMYGLDFAKSVVPEDIPRLDLPEG
jgi:hypothetical protein